MKFIADDIRRRTNFLLEEVSVNYRQLKIIEHNYKHSVANLNYLEQLALNSEYNKTVTQLKKEYADFADLHHQIGMKLASIKKIANSSTYTNQGDIKSKKLELETEVEIDLKKFSLQKDRIIKTLNYLNSKYEIHPSFEIYA